MSKRQPAAAAGRSVDRMLAGWDVERVVIAHGEVIETGGADALREASEVGLLSTGPEETAWYAPHVSATAMPGVLAVITGKTLEGAGLNTVSAGVPFPGKGGAMPISPFRPALATDRARHVGEPVDHRLVTDPAHDPQQQSPAEQHDDVRLVRDVEPLEPSEATRAPTVAEVVQRADAQHRRGGCVGHASPSAAGRSGSDDHPDQLATNNLGRARPARSIASTFMHALTPDPQYAIVSPAVASSTPSAA